MKNMLREHNGTVVSSALERTVSTEEIELGPVGPINSFASVSVLFLLVIRYYQCRWKVRK